MNKRTFWLVWAVGCVPMLLAFVMYFTGVAVPEGRVNHGELLSGQQLDQWFGEQAAAEPLSSGSWQLLLTAPEGCDSSCSDWWHNLQQVQTALGKDRDRVELQLLDSSVQGLDAAKLDSIGEAVWIADPLGNLVLRYELQQSPDALLEDLRKLLKVSKVG